MNFLKKIDIFYIITLLFLLLSSNANFLSANNIYWFIILGFISTVAVSKKILNITDLKIIILFALIYLILVALRDIFINELDSELILSDVIFLFKYLLLSFVYVATLKEKVIPYLVRVIVHLTVLSFFFFFLQIIGFADIIYRYSQALNLPSGNNIEGYTNFVFFSFTRGRHDYANSGFVWEPGAFGCFLSIALLLHFFVNKFRFDKSAIILLLGIITTFSTTTYLALLVILFLTYRARLPKVNRWIILLVPVFLFLIISIPILSDKIGETYYEDMSDLNRLTILERYYRRQNQQIPLNRFASMQYIYTSFGSHLLLGVNNKYNVILNKKMDVDISNGIFDFLAKFGLVGYLFLLYCYGKVCFMYLRNRELLIYCILVFIIIGFGEPMLHLPMMLMFIFLYLWKINTASTQTPFSRI